jgi:acyl-CoA dehydrogenase
VHKVTLAREVLGMYKPSTDVFPSYHLPRVEAEAQAKYAELLADLEV